MEKQIKKEAIAAIHCFLELGEIFYTQPIFMVLNEQRIEKAMLGNGRNTLSLQNSGLIYKLDIE